MTAQEIGQLLIAHDALAEEEHDDHDDDGDDRHAEAVLEEARRRDAEELAGIQTAQQPLERRDVEKLVSTLPVMEPMPPMTTSSKIS